MEFNNLVLKVLLEEPLYNSQPSGFGDREQRHRGDLPGKMAEQCEPVGVKLASVCCLYHTRYKTESQACKASECKKV